MCRFYLWTTIALLTADVPVCLADLSKVDRTIAKEPAYKAKPKYCLVVLGPEAKTRVWLVLDGDVLYADHNGDGDLTGKDKRFLKEKGLRAYEVGIPARPGGGPVSLKVEDKPGRDGEETSYRIWCRPPEGKGFLQRTDGMLLFADRPQEAPVVHFGGPLTLTILDWYKPLQPRQLVRGGKDNQLSILVGTPVAGGRHEAFASVDRVFRGDSLPVVEVEFPGKDAGAKAFITRAKVRR